MQTRSLPLLGLFGGTFDPIHNGHLYVLTHALQQLPFETIQLIPCGLNPPHRHSPIASIKDRLTLIKLAIGDNAKLDINTMEIESNDVSYSINTIKKIRLQFPRHALGFILSTDNLATFNQWHEWKTFLNYCHLIIVFRHHRPLPNESWLNQFLQMHQTSNPDDLTHSAQGKIFFTAITPPPYSATHIREELKKGNISTLDNALPRAVLHYLKQHALYTVK